jgi:starch-binding outer membrane protein, SusD/RagB family
MKTKILYNSIIFVVLLLTNISCSDFLIEDNKTGATEDVVYSTKTGIDGLVGASYSYLRGWYGKQGGVYLSEGGSDLWLTGYDNQEKPLVNYSGITPQILPKGTNPAFDEYWELLYTAINVCNTGLKFVGEAPSTTLSVADKDAYTGELKALRAFYYWHLVETWGPVQINTEPQSSALSTATRSSEQDVYAFMLQDINDAITLLAGKTAKTGHINLWAAKAMKARFLLYKASKFNDNQAYIDAAAAAEEVISGSGTSFFANYADCWNVQNINGITNKEVIWWVDYSSVLENNILPYRLKTNASGSAIAFSAVLGGSGTQGGNYMHLAYVGVWNFLPALTTVFVRTASEAAKTITYSGKKYNLGTDYQAYSKGFTEFSPSGYLLDVFNDATDQRYQASFRDTWYLAKELQTAFATGVAPPTGFANMRDTAVYMSKTRVTPANVISRAANRYVLFSRTDVNNPLVYPLYQDADGTMSTIASTSAGNDNYKGNRMYINLKKFDDLAGSIIVNNSDRDAFVIRLSEMYLIAAEAYMMSGNAVQGIAKLNALRTTRAIAGKSNVLTAAEESQVSSKDINVILDERARELCGEQQRWFDLKRTGKLLERVKAYNGYAKDNIKDFHILRPIPQPQLDAITNKTSGPDDNGFWQNPGY